MTVADCGPTGGTGSGLPLPLVAGRGAETSSGRWLATLSCRPPRVTQNNGLGQVFYRLHRVFELREGRGSRVV